MSCTYLDLFALFPHRGPSRAGAVPGLAASLSLGLGHVRAQASQSVVLSHISSLCLGHPEGCPSPQQHILTLRTVPRQGHRTRLETHCVAFLVVTWLFSGYQNPPAPILITLLSCFLSLFFSFAGFP